MNGHYSVAQTHPEKPTWTSLLTSTYWLTERGFDELWRRTSISQSAFDWLTWAVYIGIAAMLESPLFIAFCVLYRELQFKQEEPALAAQAL
jgi:hypothetical protein